MELGGVVVESGWIDKAVAWAVSRVHKKKRNMEQRQLGVVDLAVVVLGCRNQLWREAGTQAACQLV